MLEALELEPLELEALALGEIELVVDSVAGADSPVGADSLVELSPIGEVILSNPLLTSDKVFILSVAKLSNELLALDVSTGPKLFSSGGVLLVSSLFLLPPPPVILSIIVVIVWTIGLFFTLVLKALRLSSFTFPVFIGAVIVFFSILDFLLSYSLVLVEVLILAVAVLTLLSLSPPPLNKFLIQVATCSILPVGFIFIFKSLLNTPLGNSLVQTFSTIVLTLLNNSFIESMLNSFEDDLKVMSP